MSVLQRETGGPVFNALKYTQELEKAGFSREQAETSVRVLIDVMNENFATKPDLKELELAVGADMKGLEAGLRSEMKELGTELRSEMKEIESSLRSDMKALELSTVTAIKELDYKLTIKLGTMLTVAVGVMTALIKLFSLRA
jgi:hypothetical protein